MARKRGRRQPKNLAGTNLHRDPRNGVYIWRRVHEHTGKRLKRSTGTKLIEVALAKAQAFEEEYEREAAGLLNFKHYRRPLNEALIAPFLDSIGSEARRDQLSKHLLRAFELLGLKRLADLENFSEIEKRLLRLEHPQDGFKRISLVRCFQQPLKQLSTFLASRRVLPIDHLAAWKRLETPRPERRRRSLSPEEAARALAASDCLDKINSRSYAMRVPWTVLLVTAPRVSAFAALDIADLDMNNGRLLFKGRGNKRAGAGALDEETFKQVRNYVDNRPEGPLFLSPTGRRIDHQRSLDRWRASVSMAIVDEEWPEDQPRTLRSVYQVHMALFTGKTDMSMGGPKSGVFEPGREKVRNRRRLAARIADIADSIRERWSERMQGVDQHCLRTTHRTWALLAGVPEILIDRQLGHTAPNSDDLREAAWSRVGREHYTDMEFLTLDARRSAEAVREMLDRAESAFQEVVESGDSALRTPEKEGRIGVA